VYATTTGAKSNEVERPVSRETDPQSNEIERPACYLAEYRTRHAKLSLGAEFGGRHIDGDSLNGRAALPFASLFTGFARVTFFPLCTIAQYCGLERPIL
jgi:hypothetical protein